MSAWHVVVLTEQLARAPHSRVYAERGGTPELQGWDQNTIIAARTHNLIAGLLAGLSSGTNVDDVAISYPSPKGKAEKRQPQTLAEFSVSGFVDFMYG